MHEDIKSRLAKKILCIDGGAGTFFQSLDLTADDFGGDDLAGCNENLIRTRPDVIRKLHQSYLDAGADIIETNTFGGTPLVLAEYDLQDHYYEINFESARVAKELAVAASTSEKPRYVCGSIGPTTKSLSVTGGITFDELADNFFQQTVALIDGGVDYLLLETALDTLNIKAGYIGILKAFESTGKTLPIAVSGTIEVMGTMLAGQGVEALYTSVEHMELLYIGLNCATGPAFMRDHIRTLAQISRFPVACVPNAGIPNADGTYPESPSDVTTILCEFAQNGWVNLVGGCCGTTPAHIEKISKIPQTFEARQLVTTRVSRLSGIDSLILEDENRPYLIGERSNVIGSRAFKNLIVEEKFEEAAEVARKQVKGGAHIVDVCLSNPDRDEVSDVGKFLDKVAKIIKVPIMVDSQVPEVVETAFKLTQGKCVLNSVNLEDGEKSFEELLPIVKKYGAAIVVGCIQNEMAVTAEQKLSVATASYDLLTQKYGIPEEDIIFDPLVFPCGTGDENYFGSGAQTIEGCRLIKEKYPKTKQTLGISNVSFGLPAAGREVLNSVFLYHCTKAGLDTAIVNAEKLVRYSQITDEEKKLCDDLLWYRTENGNDPIANFAAYFRGKETRTEVTVDRSTLSVNEKIEINIVQGTKEYLIENLDEALTQWDPLGVINNPLMRAMDIVGKMFNANELIVAEVLQSAEVMKAAVSHLEQFMDANETNVRGTMLLATVKGDVHDIGKNLVQIIMGNNGYKIIDLGIKCPPETLIEAHKTHKPNLIGLSGLLVKSAQQMVITAQDLKANNIQTPILVGGAALTDNFTRQKIAPEYGGPVLYCKDAMNGLDVANKLMNPDERLKLLDALSQPVQTASLAPRSATKIYAEPLIFTHDVTHGKVPSFAPQILEVSMNEVWPFLNLQMLYGNHLGIKGSVEKMLATGEAKATKIKVKLDELKERIIAENLLTGKCHYQFYKARKDGNVLVILDESERRELQRFHFPRQSDGHQLCLTDFVSPTETDTVCFFAVTCGDGVSELAKSWLEAGNYFDSHALYSLALESAEALAEFLHCRIRKEWGFPDPPELTVKDMYKLRYDGVRVSFGYPACPRLEDQEKMWDLMHPDQTIDITLTEEYMMRPEASVSALVFHNPQARYFSISPEDLAEFEKNQ